MPVSLLLVEAPLDAQVLGAIAPSGCTVKPAGSKNRLKPMIDDMRATGNTAYYLRDRDFDQLPPETARAPIVDSTDGDGQALGWRWSRHELENYLLEPPLVRAATGWGLEEWERALHHAGRMIAMYQAARQAIGLAKRTLPPYYRLSTRPEALGRRELVIPDLLDADSSRLWASCQISTFYENLTGSLGPVAARTAIDMAMERWRDRPATPQEALIWCSGKDLLAALAPWLAQRKASPHDLRIRLRDQILKDPDAALTLLPEWSALVATLRG